MSDPVIAGLKVYLVGGAVRDRLLDLPVKEKDYVVVGSSAQEMLARGFRSVGQDFPVFLHPKTGEEYALARLERKTAKGYHGFEFEALPDVSLEQDLSRRDLTINAMAIDPAGHLVDPFNGQLDVRDRILRHVSPAFVEDPVRILRLGRFLARFARLGFQVADQTQRLMQEMVKQGEVSALNPDRVWKEWSRALLEAAPDAFFQVLFDSGAFAILFPEAEQKNFQWGLLDNLPLKLSIRFAKALQALGYDANLNLLKKLFVRFKCPNDCRELAQLWAAYRPKLESRLLAEPEMLWEVIHGVDAIRRPGRFEDLCALIPDQSLRIRWANVLKSVNSVVPQPLMAAGYQGLELKKALVDARINALKRDFPSAV